MFKVEVLKMKWNLFVKRILTCALAAATIATAVPVYAYATETEDEVIVVEDEEDAVDAVIEEDEGLADAEIADESLDNVAAEDTVVVGVSRRLDEYGTFERGEGFTGEMIDGRDVVSANGFTFTITDNDTTDEFKPFASLLSKIITPSAVDGAVYTYTVTAEDIKKASVYKEKGKTYRILRVGLADKIITLNANSDFKSVVLNAYFIDDNKKIKELNGPVDVYAGTSEFDFRSGNRIVIGGFGELNTDHPNGSGFVRVTAGDKKFYGDPWWDTKDGLDTVLIDFETLNDSVDILVEETGLKKDAITAEGDIEGDYDITTEVVSGKSGEYVTNSKEYDKAKVKLTVEDTGVKAYKIASMDATIKYGDKEQATTLIKDSKGIYCEIPSEILAEAAFLDKPSIVIIPKVEDEKVKSISVKGFKYDKTELANKVAQTTGTTKDYQMTIAPKTCHLSGLDVSITVGGEYADASIVKDSKNNYYLQVATFKGDSNATTPIWIELVDKKNPFITYGDPFVVTPEAAKKLPAPTVKVMETTDISATLSLALPSAASSYSDLLYKIEGKANVGNKKSVTDGMAEEIGPIYVPSNESSHYVYLMKEAGKSSGEGHAQKYDFEVTLVQGDVSRPLVISPAKKVSASTKEPAYETKLGLKKVKSAFILGESDITLATAKYNAKTTFRELELAEITDASGNVVRTSDTDDDLKKITIDGDKIILEDSAGLTVGGKYTLSVWPKSKAGGKAGKAATLKLTVKQGIDELTLTMTKTSYVKKNNKSLSINAPKVTYNGGKKTPAVKKVKWELVEVDSQLDGKVSINNKGAVTVDKDLTIPAGVTYGFKIMATPDDYVGNDADAAKTDVIELTAEETKPSTSSSELTIITDESMVKKNDIVFERGVIEKNGKKYVTGEDIVFRITGEGTDYVDGVSLYTKAKSDKVVMADYKDGNGRFDSNTVSEKMKKSKEIYFNLTFK